MRHLRSYVGLHHWSTWMILVGIIPVAIQNHPSIFSMLLVFGILCWQLMTREIARFETGQGSVNWHCLGGCAAALLGIGFLMTRISWVAL